MGTASTPPELQPKIVQSCSFNLLLTQSTWINMHYQDKLFLGALYFFAEALQIVGEATHEILVI